MSTFGSFWEIWLNMIAWYHKLWIIPPRQRSASKLPYKFFIRILVINVVLHDGYFKKHSQIRRNVAILKYFLNFLSFLLQAESSDNSVDLLQEVKLDRSRDELYCATTALVQSVVDLNCAVQQGQTESLVGSVTVGITAVRVKLRFLSCTYRCHFNQSTLWLSLSWTAATREVAFWQ